MRNRALWAALLVVGVVLEYAPVLALPTLSDDAYPELFWPDGDPSTRAWADQRPLRAWAVRAALALTHGSPAGVNLLAWVFLALHVAVALLMWRFLEGPARVAPAVATGCLLVVHGLQAFQVQMAWMVLGLHAVPHLLAVCAVWGVGGWGWGADAHDGAPVLPRAPNLHRFALAAVAAVLAMLTYQPAMYLPLGLEVAWVLQARAGKAAAGVVARTVGVLGFAHAVAAGINALGAPREAATHAKLRAFQQDMEAAPFTMLLRQVFRAVQSLAWGDVASPFSYAGTVAVAVVLLALVGAAVGVDLRERRARDIAWDWGLVSALVLCAWVPIVVQYPLYAHRTAAPMGLALVFIIAHGVGALRWLPVPAALQPAGVSMLLVAAVLSVLVGNRSILRGYILPRQHELQFIRTELVRQGVQPGDVVRVLLPGTWSACVHPPCSGWVEFDTAFTARDPYAQAGIARMALLTLGMPADSVRWSFVEAERDAAEPPVTEPGARAVVVDMRVLESALRRQAAATPASWPLW